MGVIAEANEGQNVEKCAKAMVSKGTGRGVTLRFRRVDSDKARGKKSWVLGKQAWPFK